MAENPLLEEMAASDFEGDGPSEHGNDESVDGISGAPEEPLNDPVRQEVDWVDYFSGQHSRRTVNSYEEGTAPPFENIVSGKTDLRSHLMWQLNMTNLDEEQREIADYIVGNLDEDGYLDIEFGDMVRALGCAEEKVRETLQLIQNLDPVGVAARDMRECLLIQARFQNLAGTIVEKIIADHLGDLEYRRYDQIAKRLRVSSYYKDVLESKDASAKSAKTYIREKLASAAWLINGIEHRQRTIYRVAKSICRYQRDFLDHGISHLKPMVLRNVAEDIEMHESTVSRATTNKWIHTPQGIFELKFFFNSPINTTNGESVASESVREQIRKIIKSEDVHKPYSDQEIEKMLKKQGIEAARRTVAKYRESMGIQTSKQRKQRY